MEGKIKKTLLYTFIVITIFSVVATFYKMVILSDFYIENDLSVEDVAAFEE